MIELGKKQVLTIKRVKTFGVYLGCEGEEQAVLLPSKYVPEGSQIGDEIEVFIYRDSQDRLVATTLEPKLKLGETGGQDWCISGLGIGKGSFSAF